MEWAALIAWIVTAGGGSVLLAIWLGKGGMEQREGTDRIRPAFVLSHFGLAATGLVLWLLYTLTDTQALAWIALVLVLAVAALGWLMFFIWLRQRRATPSPGEGAAAAAPAEQNFPRALVALHGVGAVATVVLVLLATLGVG
ncbi:MAG: hypothetical protein ICV64_06050 [Thermoleophilia bacterium]|nr:hypothetical protein [Thermoleophilia bacterium]